MKWFAGKSFRSFMVLAALAPASFLHATASPNTGTDFWLAFPEDAAGPSNPQTLQLLINAETAASVTVLDPSVGTPAIYNVVPGTTTTAVISQATQVQTSDTVTHLGIHLTANNQVSVYGLAYETATSDGYLGLPTITLGESYMVISYPTLDSTSPFPSDFVVAGTANGTVVTITPSITVGTRTAGVPYTINLNQGDTYGLNAPLVFGTDLTGTLIQSSQPIGLFSGSQCADVPDNSAACNYLVEEIWPLSNWGVTFATLPYLYGTSNNPGSLFRVLAASAATTVSVNGAAVATLNAAQWTDQTITVPALITANNPVYVAEYSQGEGEWNAAGNNYSGLMDPFMTSVPPVSCYLADYDVGVMTITEAFDNYEIITAPTSSVGSILLDGTAIPAADFTAIGAGGYSGAAITVTDGLHHLTGPVSFGALAYGYPYSGNPALDSADGYGYPAGLLVENGISTATPTPTFTPTITPTFTISPTPSPTFTPTLSPTVTPTFTPTCVIHVWPDPYNPKYAVGGTLKIGCLSSGAVVSFYTVSGELVNQAGEIGGEAQWNGANRQGVPVSPGIYFYVIQNAGNVSGQGKFLIER